MHYNSLNDYLQTTYGEKIYKLSLSANVSCPNRDGTLSDKGCIFCRDGARTVYSPSPETEIAEQLKKAKELIREKTKAQSFIAYFQSYTNTYAPTEYLKKIFYEAIQPPEVKILSVATRPDCLCDDVLSLLDEINQKKAVWTELGLQTSNDETAEIINRGYNLSVFDDAVKKLNALNIKVVAHIIIGLPGETREDMLETVKHIVQLNVWGVKFHLLHVLEDTELEKMYLRGEYTPLTKEEYINTVLEFIEYLPSETVIHRLTGDPDKNYLVAPKWCTNKRDVLNSFKREMHKKDIIQGRMVRG